MIGSGLGPYLVGKISSAQGSLSTGVLCALAAAPIAATALYLCARRVEAAETSKWDRARAAGEAA
jgi:cyanate permease